MKSQAAATEACRHAHERNPEMRYAIFKIGPAWMYTSQAQEAVEAIYKNPVKYYTIIFEGKVSEVTIFHIGDYVKTKKGAAFRGIVVSTYITYKTKEPRADVEGIDPAFEGTIHVYPTGQLTSWQPGLDLLLK